MSVTPQIELPDQAASLLVEQSRRERLSVSEFVQRLLARGCGGDPAVLTDEEYARDPLWSIAGMANTGVPDLSVNHDSYLYDQ
jgi:hypothetical protein